MIQVNEYYEGTVKSMALETKDGKFTVGVMEKGEYEFTTACVEIMTVVCGEMKVLLAGSDNWQIIKPFNSFRVENGDTFKLEIEEVCSYRCQYL